MPVFKKNNCNDIIVRFDRDNKESVRKPKKLKKLSKSQKLTKLRKKPSKSRKSHKINAKKTKPIFLTVEAKIIFNHLWLTFTKALIL